MLIVHVPRTAFVLFAIWTLFLSNSQAAIINERIPLATTLDNPVTAARLIARLDTDSPDLAKSTSETLTTSKPVIVFIHGVLGSALTTIVNKNEINLWGKSGDKNASDDQRAKLLSFCSKTKIKATILHKYNTKLSSSDVYGNWISALKTEVTDADPEFFAYDWRKPIADIADDLETWIRGKETAWGKPKRDVVFVAHSMGGLVLTDWYFRKYSNNEAKYAFALERVIFAATPHYGAPSALQTLLEGYRPATSWLPGFAVDWFTAPVQKVGYTFPSLYYLLPYPGTDFVEINNVQKSFDVFKSDDWMGNALHPRHSKKIQKNSCWNLQIFLDRAEAFQDNLEKMGPVPGATYCYSDSKKTPELLKIISGKRSWIRKPSSGDGRVMAESAKNDRRVINSKELPHYCYSENDHGGILNSRNLLKQLESIANVLKRRRDRKVGEDAIENPLLKTALVDLNIVLPTSNLVAKGETLTPKNLVAFVTAEFSDATTRWMHKHNFKVLTGEDAFPESNTKRADFYGAVALASQNLPMKQAFSVDQVQIRKYVNASWMAFTARKSEFIKAANSLGHIMIQEGKNAQAKNWYDKVKETNEFRLNSLTPLGDMLTRNQAAAAFRMKNVEADYKDEFKQFRGKN